MLAKQSYRLVEKITHLTARSDPFAGHQEDRSEESTALGRRLVELEPRVTVILSDQR